MRGGGVGDVVLTLPAIGALRLAFPKAHIEVLGDPGRLRLARHPAYADAVMDAEALDLYRLFSRAVREPGRLARYLGGFDLILSYVAARDPVFMDNVRRYGAGDVIAWPPHPGAAVHAADHLLQPVSGFVDAAPSAEPRVYPQTEHRRAADAFWRSAGLPEHGVLALHAGSGGRAQAVAAGGLATGPGLGRGARRARHLDQRAGRAGARAPAEGAPWRVETGVRRAAAGPGGHP